MKSRALSLLLVVFSAMLLAFGAFSVQRLASVERQRQLNVHLIAAIKQNDVSAVKNLLAKGADPNAHSRIDELQTSLWQQIQTQWHTPHSKAGTKTALSAALERSDPVTESPNVVICTELLKHGAAFEKRPGHYMRVFKGRFHHGDGYYVDIMLCCEGSDYDDNGFTLRGTEKQLDAFVEAALRAGARRY